MFGPYGKRVPASEEEIETLEQGINLENTTEQDPEKVLDSGMSSYEEKLEAMKRIKDRYLKPRE